MPLQHASEALTTADQVSSVDEEGLFSSQSTKDQKEEEEQKPKVQPVQPEPTEKENE